jgi:protein ImuB
LPTDRLARQSPDLSSGLPSPLAIYGRRGNADVIVALDAQTQALGLSRGLTLAQARAMHPDLHAVEENAGADSALLDRLADWALRYTPLVATDLPDGLLLDISGCAHLYGGERALVTDLAKRLTRDGFGRQIAVAGTIGAAFAAARFDHSGLYRNGGERALLAPLPLAALRLPAPTVAAMARVGLKRIGDIVDLPRAPLAARFGGDLLRQLDRALGVEHEPLNPRLPVAPYVVERRFAEPIAREDDVLTTVETLAARLRSTLEQRGDGARRIELTLFRTDGAVRRLDAATSRPVRDPAAIRALFVERLAALADAFDPGFGFDMARLSVPVAEPMPDTQVGLDCGNEDGALGQLVDRLSARLGAQRVRRPVAQDSHIPELTAATVPAQMTGIEPGWDAFRRDRAEQDIGPRPLRLLAKPEPIAREDDVLATD